MIVAMRYALPDGHPPTYQQQLTLAPPDSRRWRVFQSHINNYGTVTIIWTTSDPEPAPPGVPVFFMTQETTRTVAFSQRTWLPQFQITAEPGDVLHWHDGPGKALHYYDQPGPLDAGFYLNSSRLQGPRCFYDGRASSCVRCGRPRTTGMSGADLEPLRPCVISSADHRV